MNRRRRIGIDIRALTPPMSGAGVALREILKRFTSLTPETEFVGYTTREAAADNLPPGPFEVRVGHGATARWGTLWFQTGIHRVLKRDGLDLFWGPLQILPLERPWRRLLGLPSPRLPAGLPPKLPPKLPMVLTVHDLVFHYYPETMSWRNRMALGRYTRPSLDRAHTILTASQATADALVSEFDLERRKVRVVHYAAGEEFCPWEPVAARRRVAEKFGVTGPYLLFVGTLEPRKNLEGLLEALAYLVDAGRFDGQVVIVGARGWNMAAFLKAMETHPLRQRLLFTGYVEEGDLPALYSAARLFVMPSLYEGFGLPVVEAMGCGTPVLCADTAPFPEITAGAVRLAPPKDPQAFAESLAELWSDEGQRRELSRRGLRRARDFSWERTASGILQCFDDVLAEVPDR